MCCLEQDGLVRQVEPGLDGVHGWQKEKIRRNDRCPCGSGKKYKHCHGGIKAHSLPPIENSLMKTDIQQKWNEIEAQQKNSCATAGAWSTHYSQ